MKDEKLFWVAFAGACLGCINLILGVASSLSMLGVLCFLGICMWEMW